MDEEICLGTETSPAHPSGKYGIIEDKTRPKKGSRVEGNDTVSVEKIEVAVNGSRVEGNDTVRVEKIEEAVHEETHRGAYVTSEHPMRGREKIGRIENENDVWINKDQEIIEEGVNETPESEQLVVDSGEAVFYTIISAFPDVED